MDELVDHEHQWLFQEQDFLHQYVFFSKLLSDDVENVSKILSKAQIDIFQKKYVVIPIHQERQEHWILMVLMNLGKIIKTNNNKCSSVNKTKIIIFDSMHVYRKVDQYCDKICKLLNYEWVRLRKNKQNNFKVPFNKKSRTILYLY